MQLLLDSQTDDVSQILTNGINIGELEHTKMEKSLTTEVYYF